jgi:hypothetical protein
MEKLDTKNFERSWSIVKELNGTHLRSERPVTPDSSVAILQTGQKSSVHTN